MIPIFFACDVKEDFRLKARMVAGGHVLPPPLESVYSVHYPLGLVTTPPKHILDDGGSHIARANNSRSM